MGYSNLFPWNISELCMRCFTHKVKTSVKIYTQTVSLNKSESIKMKAHLTQRQSNNLKHFHLQTLNTFLCNCFIYKHKCIYKHIFHSAMFVFSSLYKTSGWSQRQERNCEQLQIYSNTVRSQIKPMINLKCDLQFQPCWKSWANK